MSHRYGQQTFSRLVTAPPNLSCHNRHEKSLPIFGAQQLNFVDYRTGTHAGSTVCFDCCAKIGFICPIALSYYGRFYGDTDFSLWKGQQELRLSLFHNFKHRSYCIAQIQHTSATLMVVSRSNCGNLAVFLTDKSKRSTHESIHTAYPSPTLPSGSPL